MKTVRFIDSLIFKVPIQYPYAKHNASSLKDYQQKLLMDFGAFVLLKEILSDFKLHANPKELQILKDYNFEGKLEEHWKELKKRMKEEGLL